MHPMLCSHRYDPSRLLDTLAAWLGVTTDKSLARMLRLSPQVIRAMRTGLLPVRASILALMAEAVERSVNELRWILGDRRRTERMSCCGRTA